MQVDLLIFDASPQALNEYVIPPASLAVHADGYVVLLQQPSKLMTGKLASLIGIEDVGLTMPVDGFLHGLNAKVRCQRIGQTPGKDLATGPVHDGKQI